jgi:hypothetical protein
MAARLLGAPRAEDMGEPSLTVKRKEYGKAKLSALAAILSLLIIAGFNIYYLYSLYADTLPDEEEKQEQGGELTEENGSLEGLDESLRFGV